MSGGADGLLASSTYLAIISGNIANASTIGYKSSKPMFFNIRAHSLNSRNIAENGVGIFKIKQNFDDGMLVHTGQDLDLGISREGFFRVLDAQNNIYYTRNGQFLLDKNKNIINVQGLFLTGYNQSVLNKDVDSDTSCAEPINLQNAYILKEQPTTEINLKALLNSQTHITPKVDNNNLTSSEDFTHYINIYQKNGQEEKISISFNKIDQNKWKVNIKSLKDTAVKSFNDTAIKPLNDAADTKNNIDDSFELEFNQYGELNSNTIFNIQPKNSKYENIRLNFTGTTEKPNLDSSMRESFQNGYGASELKTFDISPNGEILGSYANAQTKVIGQILLSKFVNPTQLQPESGNLWSATAESGVEQIGIAGNNGFGILNNKSLEASNVDLNQELINMIIAQRNYQSNAQSFKAEDKIINTLINLR